MQRHRWHANARFALALAVLCLGAQVASAVSIEFVPVGNLGNAPDPLTGKGKVDTIYQIGKYEVTNAQYAEFLNAKATIGVKLQLYNESMSPPPPELPGLPRYGGISRSGLGTVENPWVYTAVPEVANNAMEHATWYNAARFINWMHNGQGRRLDGDRRLHVAGQLRDSNQRGINRTKSRCRLLAS